MIASIRNILLYAALVAPLGAWGEEWPVKRAMPGGPSALMPRPAPALASQGEIPVMGGVIHYFFDADDYALPRGELLAWVHRSARAVSRYFGRFPVRETHLAIVQVPGSGVKTGRSIGGEKPTINVFVGRASKARDLAEDWILVHEMVHLAFPSVARRHHWLEEGLATYVESIARVGVGDLTPEFVWDGFVRGMPHGLPKAGDRGLDHTPTWGRTYWGGALYFLLVDVEIRRRTESRHSLRDALRALVEAGATIERDMTPQAIFAIADGAVGVPVLAEQYERMKAAPVAVDLERLWHRLGVRRGAEGTTFEDGAELASLRRAITARFDEGG